MTLIISRPDIVSSHIVQATSLEAKYFADREIDLKSPQIAIVNAFHQYRFITAAISRRLGKTFVANLLGHVTTLRPNSHVLIVSPNFSLSSISFDLQRQFNKEENIELEKDNVKDRILELPNASTVRMGSINQVDSLVGRSYDLIIFDEAALAEKGKDAFQRALRPTLDKPGSRAMFISTPRGKTNWFHEMYQRGFSSEFPQWASIRATYHENPSISEADIEEARSSMSKALFAQEYLADFNVYEGQIWDMPLVEEVDKAGILANLKDFEIIGGVDVGFRDDTACVIIAYHYTSGTYYVIDEYKENEKTTATHASALRALMDRWGVDYLYIDSAAAQTRHDLAMDYDISTINAKKSILDGIGFVAGLVDNGKLVVDPSCKYVLEAFDGYQWETDTTKDEKTKKNHARHMADALRYALYSHMT